MRKKYQFCFVIIIRYINLTVLKRVYLMRIRHKPWAKPELEASNFFVRNPDELKGKWHERFVKKQPLHIELGCGKGGFISQAAYLNPDINFLAIDIKYEMLGLARRNISKVFEEHNAKPENVILTVHNIERINLMLDENDSAERIYINFCNPWPRPKHKKRRLTHYRQLMNYRTFLLDNGEIYFKTDDDALFRESLEYFDKCGFQISYITYDLHNSGYGPNIVTEHEKMFSDEGIKIKFLIAKKTILPT